jgi:hypothetical protein
MKTACIPSSTLNEIHIPMNSNFIKLNLKLIQLSSIKFNWKEMGCKIGPKGYWECACDYDFGKNKIKKKKKKTLISNTNSKNTFYHSSLKWELDK